MATFHTPDQFFVKQEDEEAAPGSSNRSSSSDVSLTPNDDSQHQPDAEDTPLQPSQPLTPEEPSEAALPPRAKRRSGPRSKTSSYLGVTKVSPPGR